MVSKKRIKMASTVDLLTCSDNHIHMELIDENDIAFAEIVLIDESEVMQMINALQEALMELSEGQVLQ